LWIQCIVLVEIVFLVALSLVWGFCIYSDDVLCRSPRSLLWSVARPMSTLPMPMPLPLSLSSRMAKRFVIPVASAHEVDTWTNAAAAASAAVFVSGNKNQPQLEFALADQPSEIFKVCEDPSIPSVRNQPLWLCPPIDHHDKKDCTPHCGVDRTRVVISQESTIVYPFSKEQYETIVSELLLLTFSTTCTENKFVAPALEIQLVIEDGSEVRRWAHALSQWKIQHKLHLWPRFQLIGDEIDQHLRVKFFTVPPKSINLVSINAKRQHEEKQQRIEAQRQLLKRQQELDQHDETMNQTEGVLETESEEEQTSQLLFDDARSNAFKKVRITQQPKPLSVSQVKSLLDSAIAATTSSESKWYYEGGCGDNTRPLQVVLYIPASMPLQLEKPESSSWFVGPRQFISLVAGIEPNDFPQENEEALGDFYFLSIISAIEGGLQELMIMDIGLHWLLPSKIATISDGNTKDSSFLVQSLDRSFPKWHYQLWWDNKLTGMFQQTYDELMLIRDNLKYHEDATSLSFSMDASAVRHVGQIYQDAVEMLNEAASFFINTSDDNSLLRETPPQFVLSKSLDSALQNARFIEKHLRISSHFQIEHFLAMFAPLLFPLLIPFAVSCYRERSRYMTKTRRHKTNQPQ
jgi:hypothetical protein